MPYKDPEKQKKAQHESYIRNKSDIRKRITKRRHASKKWFREEILYKSKCELCGESDPRCLDFHHINPKTKKGRVPGMVAVALNKKQILEEVAKCQILCANCHRKTDPHFKHYHG